MDTNRACRKLTGLAFLVMLTFTYPARGDGGFTAEELSVADLEQAFWVCDYLATTRGIGAAPIDLCSSIMHELKTRRFGGDYEELVGWWRQNKFMEHGRLEAAALR